MHAHPLIRREFQNDPMRAIPSGCVSQWTPGHRRTGVCMCARTSRRRRDGRQRCCAACNLGRSMVKQLNPSHDRTHTSTLTYKLCLVIRQYGPVSMSRHSHAVTDTFGYLRDITIAPVGFNFQAEHTHTHKRTRIHCERANRETPRLGPGTTRETGRDHTLSESAVRVRRRVCLARGLWLRLRLPARARVCPCPKGYCD